MYREHTPAFISYFLASFMIAHRQSTVASLSVLVEFNVIELPSIAPLPYMLIFMFKGEVIFQAVEPFLLFTDASKPPFILPCLKDLVSSTILPSDFVSPVSLLHMIA